MKDIRLHQKLLYYFRSSLFQPVFHCRHQYKILDGYIQLLEVAYKPSFFKEFLMHPSLTSFAQ